MKLRQVKIKTWRLTANIITLARRAILLLRGSLFIYPLFISNTYLCRPLRPRTNELPPPNLHPTPLHYTHTRARACTHALKGEQHLRCALMMTVKSLDPKVKRAFKRCVSPSGSSVHVLLHTLMLSPQKYSLLLLTDRKHLIFAFHLNKSSCRRGVSPHLREPTLNL